MGKGAVTLDGNEAAAFIAYQLSEVISIYPITPSSPMGEWADAWAAERKPNLWGAVPTVVEMQSEAGAAGALHGSIQAGSLATTFTASQGLLLMIPNMYKIAGELASTVIHVASRSIAAQALSIFGDHSDVMAARGTGFAMLCSASVQEAMDFALIAHAASLKSRIPFVHFFDGFRISHEASKIEPISLEHIRTMIDEQLVLEHKARGLSPDRPVLRGTAQNPDVYFQARETVNPYYAKCPEITQQVMDEFARLTGRRHRLFEYYGDPGAERVIVLMGSAAETAEETCGHLNAKGEKVGVLKVRLFRPFDAKRFFETLPASVKTLAVLDRAKEPGSAGEPLYLDALDAAVEGIRNHWGGLSALPCVIGGRYGLSSKEFTPAMIKGVFDHLRESQPKNHFTIGIQDDLSNTSLPYDAGFSIEEENEFRAIFYGLGSDGTVGANKNSIKIIGERTGHFVQGYFIYDSRKAGGVTISHLKFGPKPIRSHCLIQQANFLACHQWMFLERYEMLASLAPGGTFLLNSPYGPEAVWDKLPRHVQGELIEKNPKFYVIDAYRVARENGMGNRINTIMQVSFFAISGVLPKEEAIAQIKKTIEKTYGKKGEDVVQMNVKAVDHALAHVHPAAVPERADGKIDMPPLVSSEAPVFVQDVLGPMIQGLGDELPVSVFPCDGTYPTGTSKWEKGNPPQEIPVWETDLCIQCGKCAFVCPHSAIRIKAYEPKFREGAPSAFKFGRAKDSDWKGLDYTIQAAEEHCTGCSLCVDICPARSKIEPELKALNMRPEPPLRDQERLNWDFFLRIPELDRRRIDAGHIRQQQAQEPLFEFSSACSGCGETPYLKLMTQLFGDRAVIANATGCSSIYGGNLPTTPWTKNAEGRGPAWSNSLFEDNAEFGFGMRLSIDQQKEYASSLLKKLAGAVGSGLADELLNAKQAGEAGIYDQRERVSVLKRKLQALGSPEAKTLLSLADMLVKKSVWIVGGDGWAYDIGFGGLDHVLASGRDVNVLVLDTEVYSNTGGQMSKSTPRAAVAKFAASGKATSKKDLGLMAMVYGNVYVASVAMGARDEHTLKAFLEAEAYEGPSLIIAYCHCIEHGMEMASAIEHHKAMVQSGRWLLYRYHPERIKQGENPLRLEPVSRKVSVEQYLELENRFRLLAKSKPEEAKRLWEKVKRDVSIRYDLFEFLASRRQRFQDG